MIKRENSVYCLFSISNKKRNQSEVLIRDFLTKHNLKGRKVNSCEDENCVWYIISDYTIKPEYMKEKIQFILEKDLIKFSGNL